MKRLLLLLLVAMPLLAQDATASLNTIIADSGGGTLHLSAGTYALSSSSVNIGVSKFSLICDSGVVFQAQSGFLSGFPEIQVQGTATDVLIQGCTFDGNSIAGTGVQITGAAARILLDHNEFKNHTSQGVEGALRIGGLLQVTNSYFHNMPVGFYDYAGNGGSPTNQVNNNSFTAITNGIAIGSSGISNAGAEYNQISNVTGGLVIPAASLYCFGCDKVQWNYNYITSTLAAVHADTVGGGSVSFNTSIGATLYGDFFAEISNNVTMKGNVSIGSMNTPFIIGAGSSTSPAALLTQYQSFNSLTGLVGGPNVTLTLNGSDHQGNSTSSLVATANASFTTGVLWYFNFASPTQQFGGFEELWVKPTSGNVNQGVLNLVCSVNTNLSTQDLIVPLSYVTLVSNTWYHLIQYANGWQGAVGGNGGSNNGWNSCGVTVTSSSPSLVVRFDDFETGPVSQGDTLESNKAIGGLGGMRWGAALGLQVLNNYVESPGGAQGIAYQNNESTNTNFSGNTSNFELGTVYSGPNTGGTHLNVDALNSASSVTVANDNSNVVANANGGLYALTNGGTMVFNITGAGAPAAGLCVAASGGSTYLRTDGAASTTLYVCTAGTWTPK
jgi:hypothetical protein